ncbi:hypothetical protein HKX48_009267 [Thoreauomyces humboldtii]|nr:hypothetical protein HKX48_009267 [Thoreauomyces humboldtii]
MPIGHSPLKYHALRLVILVVDAIPSLCLVLTLLRLVSLVHHRRWVPVTSYPNVEAGVAAWMLLETLFVAWGEMKRREFQKHVREDVYPVLREDERHFLFNRIMNTIAKPRFPAFLCSNFMWRSTSTLLGPTSLSSIRLGDIRDLLAWFLFSKPSFEHLSAGNQRECDRMVQHLLVVQGLEGQMEDGHNPDIEAVTVTFNEVKSLRKPLAMYAGVAALVMAFRIPLWICGFRRKRTEGKDGMGYWVRLAKTTVKTRRKDGKDPLPIVFIHGLGGGLWCYARFILKLFLTHRNHPIYLLELPHVSMRFTSTSPDADASVRSMTAMLSTHSHTKCILVGHSLGTAYQSYLNKHTTLVSGNVFIDPICFKIYDLGVVFNFVHRPPTTKANELLLHWLVARELWISHWISRHFVWHRIHLLPSSLPRNTHVFLSEDDNIIKSHVAESYLRDHGISTTVMEGADHAQFLVDGKREDEVVERIRRVVERAQRETGTVVIGTGSRGKKARRKNEMMTTTMTTVVVERRRRRRVSVDVAGAWIAPAIES